METVLQISGLTKRFAKTIAVDDISFSLRAGEIAGLIGPNGAGKTTTLKCVMGLLNITAGAIEVAGAGSLTEAAKRKLAYIPEAPDLYPQLTVWEHLRFIALAYRLTGWEDRARQLLQRFDLTEKTGALASELSKGMKQKVSVCCALLHDPEVFLVDEPMIGLDPKAIHEMKEILTGLRDDGKTILLSTHLLDIAEDLCDSVVVMNRGRIIFSGSLAELKDTMKAGSDSTLEQLFLEVTGQND